MTVSPSPWHDYRVVPEKLNLAHDVLEASMTRACGSLPALIGDFGIVTYEALRQRVNTVAAGLLDLNLKRG
ncbi:MAG TPA: hypothetical protein VMS25_16715, partial [Candidatus Limnocylindrales bacterium]|nr:hypothetical protein [Candidatus Limnocylindrales bacterium]